MSKSIKASDLPLFYGQQVYVVYALKSEMIIVDGHVAFTKDQNVTPSVTLVSYNPNTQEVEFRRSASSATEWIRPTLVFLV
jgi:hypothetical protein